jgi:DNA repair protein RecN (Recombination protein N)
MLAFLKVKNVTLIDEIEVEFGPGLNLLTGETGSGKSIIVDSLGALVGGRVSSDIIKQGAEGAQIEGIFSLAGNDGIREACGEHGIELEPDDAELIIRRQISAAGRNRVFVNGQLTTTAALREIGARLVEIHGQGAHAALFEPQNHLELFDRQTSGLKLRRETAEAYGRWAESRSELDALRKDQADKLQLMDILSFQVNEIRSLGLEPGEDDKLQDEKRRLANVEKLTALSSEAYALLYEDEHSTLATLEKALRSINGLAEFDQRFRIYSDAAEELKAGIEDMALAARDYRNGIEFSPERLAEIEDRLAEISRVTRKYGGTIAATLLHFEDAAARLEGLETAEARELELQRDVERLREEYAAAAARLREHRLKARAGFERSVLAGLRQVALEKAVFEARIEGPGDAAEESCFTARGFDRLEFYFSANPGEEPKPLARIASGGEASRLTLILKTVGSETAAAGTTVFDEIDAGVGGRVAEAVGRKLRSLAGGQQVLCVTHQPQVASMADRHLLIEKQTRRGRTSIVVRELDDAGRVEEIARMLAGEKITGEARENARALIAAAGQPPRVPHYL